MNWKKALGYGILAWAVMFIVASIFAAYDVTTGMTMTIVVGLAYLIAIFFAAKFVMPKSNGVALYYGLVFAVVGIILDYFISQKFVPENMFASVWYWVIYILVILVPLLAVKKMVATEIPPQEQ